MSNLINDVLKDQTGWVALAGTITGGRDIYPVAYDWDERYWATKDEAITAGYKLADDTDDFNVGFVDHGKLTWFGWMDDQHPVEGYPIVAEQFGWSS